MRRKIKRKSKRGSRLTARERYSVAKSVTMATIWGQYDKLEESICNSYNISRSYAKELAARLRESASVIYAIITNLTANADRENEIAVGFVSFLEAWERIHAALQFNGALESIFRAYLLGAHPFERTELMGVWGAEKDICVPVYRGKRKTPAIFRRRLYTQLMGIKGDKGARQLIDDNPDRVLAVEIKDPICFFDVDTRQDFERLKKNLKKEM